MQSSTTRPVTGNTFFTTFIAWGTTLFWSEAGITGLYLRNGLTQSQLHGKMIRKTRKAAILQIQKQEKGRIPYRRNISTQHSGMLPSVIPAVTLYLLISLIFLLQKDLSTRSFNQVSGY